MAELLAREYGLTRVKDVEYLSVKETGVYCEQMIFKGVACCYDNQIISWRLP